MPDNYEVSEGSGKVMASNEIGGVNFPRVKLIHGEPGDNDGDISKENPLPTATQKVDTVTTEEFKTITTSSSIIFAANPSRIKCWIKNTGAVDIFVSLSGTATTSKPTRIIPGQIYIIENYTGALS